MKRYLFDENTKEYLKPITVTINLKKSREIGQIVYFVPPNSTNIAPPPKKRGYKIIFKDTEWIYEKINKRISKDETEELKELILTELKTKYNRIIEKPIKIENLYFNYSDLEILEQLNNDYTNNLYRIAQQIKDNEKEIKINSNNYFLKEHRLKLLNDYKNQENTKITFTVIYRIIPNILPIEVSFEYSKFYKYYSLLKEYIEKINRIYKNYLEKIENYNYNELKNLEINF